MLKENKVKTMKINFPEGSINIFIFVELKLWLFSRSLCNKGLSSEKVIPPIGTCNQSSNRSKDGHLFGFGSGSGPE